MRKFLAILCSVMLVMSSLTVYGATDPYDFDGDIIDNPWAELFTTSASENDTTEAPTEEVTTTEEATTSGDQYAGLTWVQVGTSDNYVAAANNDFEFQLLEDQGTQMLIIPVVNEGAKPIWPDFTNATLNGEEFEQRAGAGIYVLYSDLIPNAYNVFEATSAIDSHRFQIIIKTGDLETPTEAPTEPEITTEAPTEPEITTEAPTEPETTTEAPTEAPTATPLAITKQPQSAEVEAGQYVNISVEATGEGLTYQWQLSNNNGATWANSGATGTAPNNINVLMKDTMDGRQYRCVVTDANGNSVESEAATLTLPEKEATKITITKQPSNITAKAGDVVSVSVNAEGEGLTYQWQVSSSGGERWGNTSLEGNNTATMTFTVGSNYNGRMYRCIITDANGNTVTSDVAVISFGTGTTGITITKQPSNITAYAGDVVSVSVNAVGAGLKYQWQVSSSGGERWGNTSLEGNDCAIMSFAIASNYDGRMYRCIITDANGNTVTSNVAVVKIGVESSGITIKKQPSNITAKVGDIVSVSVSAEGEGLQYQWQVSSSGGERWGNTGLEGNKSPIMTFAIESNYNGRMYRCVITDANGNTVTSDVCTVTLK